jgi:predicted DNA binding protein
MKKNNSAYIILLLAALLFFFIKINQRGKKANIRSRVTVENAVDTYFKIRDTTKQIIYNYKITCKMQCMGITKADVQEMMQIGELNFEAVEAIENVYPIVGKTKTGKNLVISMLLEDTCKRLVTVVNKDTSNNCDMCR